MLDKTRVVFDSRQDGTADLCVLIPVRNDRKLFALLDGLKTQVTDRVHVYVLNDLQPDPFVRELPSPIRGVVFHYRELCSIAEKINTLLQAARGEWVVIIESDTIPDARWIADLLRMIPGLDPNAVHVGGEIYEKPLNLNNVLFRKSLPVPPHEEDTFWANDTGWFLACDARGIPLIHHDREALVYHDTVSKQAQFNRLVQYAYDFAYLAAKYGRFDFFKRKVLAEGYFLARALIMLPLLLLCYAGFKLARLFRRGARPS